MKKFVLNIDRLYCGSTANSVVLRQVDQSFPTLVPSLHRLEDYDAFSFIWRQKYPNFNPPISDDLAKINEYIVDFNIGLQTEFKKNGHEELYMMDDTENMKPSISSFSGDKEYMHSINGKTDDNIYSSQISVLFPYRKISSKSLYAEQVKITSSRQIDDILEYYRNVTLTGRYSKEKSIQGTATVGNSLFVLSPMVETALSGLVGNSFVFQNNYLNNTFSIPFSMTLFQPSGENIEDSTVQEYKDWCKLHNNKITVKPKEEYGGFVSDLYLYGKCSYHLDLATYGVTDINGIPLTSSQFREMRSGKSENGFYLNRNYVIDNSDGQSKLKFNLYENFLNGQYRILKIKIPANQDAIHDKLNFTVLEEKDGDIDYEYLVLVNDEVCCENEAGEFSYELKEPNMRDNVFQIKILIHYDVDYNRRSTDTAYQNELKNSGISIQDIYLDSNEEKTNLTYGDYLNEQGIDEEEHLKRYEAFWKNITKYYKNIPYQTILETPLKNTLTNGIQFPNNYSTGDIYGDAFATKNILNQRYDMEMEKYEDKNCYISIGRNYKRIGQCSNQLFLTYDTTYVRIFGENGEFISTRGRNIID